MKSFLAGLGLGMGAGMLLAPEAGSQTRKKMRDRVTNVITRVRESAQPLVKPLRDQVEKASGAAESTAQNFGTDIEAADNAETLEILNSATKTKLVSVSGIGDATARRIIEGRPYTSTDSILADGILSEEQLTKLKKQMLTEEDEAA